MRWSHYNNVLERYVSERIHLWFQMWFSNPHWQILLDRRWDHVVLDKRPMKSGFGPVKYCDFAPKFKVQNQTLTSLIIIPFPNFHKYKGSNPVTMSPHYHSNSRS